MLIEGVIEDFDLSCLNMARKPRKQTKAANQNKRKQTLTKSLVATQKKKNESDDDTAFTRDETKTTSRNNSKKSQYTKQNRIREEDRRAWKRTILIIWTNQLKTKVSLTLPKTR